MATRPGPPCPLSVIKTTMPPRASTALVRSDPASPVLVRGYSARSIGLRSEVKKLWRFNVSPIDPTSPIPAYAQLEQDLRRCIQSGERTDGGRLPPEQTLARLYGVSRVTLRQALQRLADAGLVSRRHGVGTIITHLPEVTLDLRPMESVTAQLRHVGYRTEVLILEQALRVAPLEITQALGLSDKAPAIVVRRRISAEGTPLAIITSWLPKAVFPGLEKKKMSATEDLWSIMTGFYKRVPASAENVVEIVRSTAQESEMLGVGFDSPLFEIACIIKDRSGRPIEHSTSHWITSRVRVHF